MSKEDWDWDTDSDGKDFGEEEPSMNDDEDEQSEDSRESENNIDASESCNDPPPVAQTNTDGHIQSAEEPVLTEQSEAELDVKEVINVEDTEEPAVTEQNEVELGLEKVINVEVINVEAAEEPAVTEKSEVKLGLEEVINVEAAEEPAVNEQCGVELGMEEVINVEAEDMTNTQTRAQDPPTPSDDPDPSENSAIDPDPDSEHQFSDFPEAVSIDEKWSDEDETEELDSPRGVVPEPNGDGASQVKNKKGRLFGWKKKQSRDEDGKQLEPEEVDENFGDPSHSDPANTRGWFGTSPKNKENNPSEDAEFNEIDNPEANDVLRSAPVTEEKFQDEPEREENKIPKIGWFSRKKNKEDEAPPEASMDNGDGDAPDRYGDPSSPDDTDPEGQDLHGYRSVVTEDEPWAESSKATSRWSSIEATKERKIITCLTLLVCCFCMLIMLGVGIGIGLTIGGDDDSDRSPSTKVPTTPPPSDLITSAPTAVPSGAPVPATVTPTPTPTPLTDSPSVSPTLDPLLAFLADNSFDDGAAVLSSGTPQRSAYEWLQGNAELDEYSDERKLARYSLATFFYATNGPTTWNVEIRDGGWATDAPECEWASTAADQCTQGIYTSLTLDDVGVTGELPLEIGHLTGLKRLSIESNGPIETGDLSGVLPDSIGNLINMETIRLTGNKMGGTIPTQIGLMTELGLLLLMSNSFGGTIPTEIGNIRGTTINFEQNELGGPIPAELFKLTDLVSIELGNNFFSGTIPTAVGDLRNLNSISLAINDFTGPIPTEIGFLTAVRTGIDFSTNDLSGPLPSEIGFLAAMREFQVQNNRLTGTVPDTYSGLVSIRRFRIDENPDISGSLPQQVCDVFVGEPVTISYSDCSTETFLCECCTFCCNRGLCACNSVDETVCDDE